MLDDLMTLSRRAVLSALQRSARKPGFPLLALDGTAGNGVDTEFLARAVGPSGRVLAVDVQLAAIENTKLRLCATGLTDRVRLVHGSHAELEPWLEPGQEVGAAMFNLGFLPGGCTHVVTRPETSLPALRFLEKRLAVRGVLSVHCYTGHSGGMEEFEAVREWAEALLWRDWRVACYDFCNKRVNREFLFLALRLRGEEGVSLIEA